MTSKQILRKTQVTTEDSNCSKILNVFVSFDAKVPVNNFQSCGDNFMPSLAEQVLSSV